MLSDYGSILEFFLNALAYLSAPVIVVFMVGIFWRGATSAGAVTTMLTSPAICYLAQHLRELTGWGPTQSSIVYWLPIAVAGCALVLVIVSLRTPRKDAALLEGLLWSYRDTVAADATLLERRDIEEGEEAEPGATGRLSFWIDHRVWAVVALLLLVGIMWYFR